jgi:CheY-like chemotaxis protein
MSSQPPVVLVADDDENDLFFLREAFERAKVSCRIETVQNGREAIGYLQGKGEYRDRELHPWPALMLLDLKMPVADGFEVLAWCGKQTWERDLPIVVMSSSNQEGDIQRALALGATAYHAKPGSFDYLVSVARALADRWLTRAGGGVVTTEKR